MNEDRGARPSGLQAVLADRVIYTTITLMSVLVVYDGWQSLSLVGVIGVVAGPILAMFISHVFSATLARHVAVGRRLSLPERVQIVRSEAPFLLFAVPPLLTLAILNLGGVSLTNAIHVVVWAGTASLGVWSGVAGRRAGLRGWSLVLAVLFGLAIGFVVLALQVFLQPGKAVSGGVAFAVPACWPGQARWPLRDPAGLAPWTSIRRRRAGQRTQCHARGEPRR